MNRLIDADALITRMNERAEEEYLDFRDCRDMAEFAPTVKAIPLEWIQNYINKANDTEGYAVANMLEEWEKEHETD